MVKTAAVTGAALVLLAGGGVGAARWHDAQVAQCHDRSAQFATADVLARVPPGFRADEVVAGCQFDPLVAAAGRQVTSRAVTDDDTPAITAYYRAALAGWEFSGWTPEPGENAALLCARKESAAGTMYVSVTPGLPGTYDVLLTDADGHGGRCH
ncbi:hypothetical protein BJY16_005906 [Actinoplanes octamycinicus]|uniref:Uncharacterized protein n=1 Tax=Actinoplanes octamycinicus TaxID=135948 RepID=A0A7W7H2G1_9ACTN|nr:hypothetical protein [Actinoplanes octamycinicus]MBB4742447.1 hypothetical protein [Actinoplanes octamycinicus]GIE62304.1 hypothetical protein Aoc01nite_77060 [Actinoplanes octamycinicus]